MEPNLDGWLIEDALTHLLKLAAPPPEPPSVPLAATQENGAETGGYWGFCDVCGHTHQFCECD